MLNSNGSSRSAFVFSCHVARTQPTDPVPLDRQASKPQIFKFSLSSNDMPLGSEYSSQPRGKKRRRPDPEVTANKLKKVNGHLERILNDFTLGEFLTLLFWYQCNKESDLRQSSHRSAVCRFLQGRTSVHPLTVVQKMYHHPASYPSYQCNPASKKQRSMAFSLDISPKNIKFAKPAISSWAAQLSVTQLHRDITRLTQTDTRNPEDVPARISPELVTWDDINSFTPERSIATIKRRAPYLYRHLRYLAEPRKSGVPVPRKNRPTDIRILTAFNTLIVGHNRYVNGYFSLPMGVQLFSLQAHTDLRRILCRMGLSVSDSTVQKALEFMTCSEREEMQQSTVEAAGRGESDKSYVFDNVQEHCAVYEGGVCRTTEMKIGTAGTAILNEDCPNGAWDLDDHLSRIVTDSQSALTVDSLMETIDWANYHDAQALYIVKTLVAEVDSLSKLHSKSITERFRAPPLAIHRLPDDRQTKIQPLGTNAEREIEIHGMKACISDFDTQVGFTAAGAEEKLVEWVSGDGATFATMRNLQKYLAPTDLGNRETLRNKIVTPELWHAKDKGLKAIVETHVGPPTSNDPSSLSRLYTLAGFKRPSNPKESDHYPTIRALETIWIAQVLDCWRIELGVGDLNAHFSELETLPSLDGLLRKASVIAELQDSLKVKIGSAWISSSVSGPSQEQMGTAEKTDEEAFDGDRSLANSILFKMQMGSWLLLQYAIKDGDIGRVMEQLKIWIFMFAGSSHQPYLSYLLDLHCLLEHQSSPELRAAILNNYLVKFGFSWHERDLMQEHHNKKLESMVEKAGGDFDGHYYRDMIAPNVDNFIKTADNWETAYGLKHRSGKHTSPATSPEIRVLLAEIKTSQLHLFCSGRSYPGHIAADLFSLGYYRLGVEGKLKAWLKKLSTRLKFIRAVEDEKRRVASNNGQQQISSTIGSSHNRNSDAGMDSNDEDSDYEVTSEDDNYGSESDVSSENEELGKGEVVESEMVQQNNGEEVMGSDEESEVDVESEAVIPGSESEWSGSEESDVK
ncbi:hypothetical protein PQX77_001026 [Marasmius sp. AFHP31]|nr:hypothetical protein PQX77_001026 [Marasmius sp. AFHP31]